MLQKAKYAAVYCLWNVAPRNRTKYYICLSSSSGSLSGAVGALGGSLGSWSICILIGLVWAVDGDLDSDLTALDLLGVHLSDGLLLHLLRGQSDETESTSLAGFVAGLKLLDHEAGDWAQGDLGGGWLISSEEFLELERY